MDPVVIDRQKWLHGEGSSNSYLLRRKDGKMCCLGFICAAVGYTPAMLIGVTTPADLNIWVSGPGPIHPTQIIAIQGRKVLEEDLVPQGLTEMPHPLERRTINSTAGERAMAINDFRIDHPSPAMVAGILDTDLQVTSEDHREQLLTDLFATIDIPVTFTN